MSEHTASPDETVGAEITPQIRGRKSSTNAARKTTAQKGPTVKHQRGAADSANLGRTPEEQMVAGKALREKVAREQLGTWKPDKRRANPLDILGRSDSDRLADLVPVRYARMLNRLSPSTAVRRP